MKNIALIAAAAAVGLVSTASQAAPASLSSSATVQILAPITITEGNALAFGKIDAPSALSASTIFTISATGAPPAHTGDGAFVSGSAAGTYSFAGETGQNVNVSAAVGAACTGGLTLSNLVLSVSSGNLPLAGVKLGGSLNVPAGTTAGNYACPYTVSAQY